MAKISYNDVQTSSYSDNSQVSFFSLKNDGDEAIVRIMHDSTNDFDIITVHDITVNGKFSTVNCLRDPREPVSACPLCQAGNKVKQQIYIHMLQYVRNEEGRIVAVPRVWARSVSWATKLANLINEYGPLSDVVVKIKRSGQAGSRETTYDVLLANPNVYKNELYPKDNKAFENYSSANISFLNRSAEDLNYFISTGTFPQKKQNNNYAPSVDKYEEPEISISGPAVIEPSVNDNYNDNNSVTPRPQPQVEQPRRMPWENNTSTTVERPNRNYY